MSIPSPNDVSAEWLGACLEKAGHAGVRVRSFSQKRIGTGQIGQCIRYELDLEGGDGSAPTSLVGKFASDDPTSRQTGIQLRNYKKEIEFYRELQQRLTISTPRCYYAEIDGDGPEFALLLEDLAPAEQGDQLAGCDTGVARAALLELVGLHAPSWCDASLREVDWIGEPSDQTIAIGRMLYQAQLPGFLDRYGSRLEADERDIIAAVAESKGPPYQKLGDVYSLVHIDYRLDNLLIDGRGDPPGITVVDWQSVGLGHPLVDVSYFLGAGLLPEVRRGSTRRPRAGVRGRRSASRRP